MIRVDKNEQFPMTVALVDENTGGMATGETVYYEVRSLPGETALSPPVAGILTESSVEDGIYETTLSFSAAGKYLFYATCSGFTTNTEDILVNEESLYDLTKQNRHYNISVEDVIRENAIATASQTIRKVAVGNTDYIVNKIKMDSDSDWSGTTASGVIYAWYKDLSDSVPYKMGGPN
jgi:hypothetical protein